MIIRSKKPDWQLAIARERIGILLGLAEKELKAHPDRSRRYVELARKIGMRYNVRMGSKNFCKKCNTLLKPGLTASHRTEKGAIVIKCLKCNNITRTKFRK